MASAELAGPAIRPALLIARADALACSYTLPLNGETSEKVSRISRR